MPASETVLAQLVGNVIELAVREGVSRHLLIQGAGLEGVDLGDGNARIPYEHLVAVWQIVARTIRDPDVGLRWASEAQPRDLGLLGYVMSFSGTLGVALARAHRYCRLLHGALDLHLQPARDGRVAVTIVDSAGGRSVEDFRIGSLVTLCRQFTRSDLTPAEVSFSYDRPRSIHAHGNLFRCEFRFGRPVSQVVFSEGDLKRPIPRSDESLAGYLSAQADTVLRSLVGGTTTRDRVRAVVWDSLSGGKPTLQRVARRVGLAPRTLQRHLAEEGTSLQQEVEDIQKTVALAVLRDRHLPIEEVAFLLGYEEPSTFFRAFRRWTGTTPQQYRRTL